MADTITTVYDPNNGKLEYEFIKHADGSMQIWQWDTENQYSWSVQVWNGTATDQAVSVDIQNDDGSFLYETFDLAHGDALAQSTLVRTDKSYTQWVYDTAGVQGWTKTGTDYTAAGQTIDSTSANRDGSTTNTYYDLAHGDTRYEVDNIAVGGAIRRTVYDTAGVQPWTSYVLDLSVAGVQLDQTVYDRNGDTEFKTWDAAHGDALQQDTLVHADGTATQWTYDTANAHSWYQAVTDYRPGNLLADQTVYNRDGSTEVKSWDAAHGDALQADTFQTRTGR